MTDSQEEFEGLELPEWVRKIALAQPNAEPPSVQAEPIPESAWPGLLQAALVASFVPEATTAKSDPDSLSAVLERCELSYQQGERRWSLKPEIRSAVLERALAGKSHFTVIADAIAKIGKVTDPTTVALQGYLAGTAPAPSDVSEVSTLEALRSAMMLLSGVNGIELPAIEEVDRRIEMRRLLEGFERIAGRIGSGSEERFHGRAAEMEAIRGYVGVIGPDSFEQHVTRVWSTVRRAVSRRAPLSVWGRGGVGKTTLVARFMLEHAQAAHLRFPFAYLDFDRSTVSVRNRSGLLVEMCSQVGAQFAELGAELQKLVADLEGGAQGTDSEGFDQDVSTFPDRALRFRQLIDRHLDDSESMFEFARPFLLVLDTFEVAQFNADCMKGLESFISSFSDERGDWPRLRLIISGRRKVETFLDGKVEELALKALDPEGSLEMLSALARGHGKSIEEKPARRLIGLIAEKLEEKGCKGLHPLRLRLLGEIFRETRTGPQIVASLIEEFSKPLDAGGAAAKLLVNGILVRRILGHIADERIKALADPGLVVRRITPAVIRDVMARGVKAPPFEDIAKADDSLSFEPWSITGAEAQDIFECFKRESLVEREGGELRHRQDIRRDMLPLIKARHPERFRNLHQLALDHYKEQLQHAGDADSAFAAEAIYHGLWLDRPLDEIEALWPMAGSAGPRVDADEFEAGSTASIYLRAKAGEVLAEDQLRRLPAGVAADWLAVYVPSLQNQKRLNDAIPRLLAAGGSQLERLDTRTGVAAQAAELYFNLGQWQSARALVARHVDSLKDDHRLGLLNLAWADSRDPAGHALQQAHVSLLRTQAVIAARLGDADAGAWLSRLGDAIRDPLVRLDVLAHLAISQAAIGVVPSKFLGTLGDTVEEIATPTSIPPGVARLVILLLGPQRVSRLADFHFSRLKRFPRDTRALDALAYLVRDDSKQRGLDSPDLVTSIHRLREKRDLTGKDYDTLWEQCGTFFRGSFSQGNPEALCTILATDHQEWVRPLGNALQRAREATRIVAGMKSRFSLNRSRPSSADAWSILEDALETGTLRATLRDYLLETKDAVSQREPNFEVLANALERWDRTLIGLSLTTPQEPMP